MSPVWSTSRVGTPTSPRGGDRRQPQSVSDTPRRVDDATLLAFLPDVPPEGFGLFPVWAPIGDDMWSPQAESASDVLQFLDENSKQVGRVWLGEHMALAVGITEYPYEIFASSALVNPYIDARRPLLLEEGVLPPDAVAFEEPESLHVMAMFRSDRRARVCVGHLPPARRPSRCGRARDRGIGGRRCAAAPWRH